MGNYSKIDFEGLNGTNNSGIGRLCDHKANASAGVIYDLKGGCFHQRVILSREGCPDRPGNE